MIWGKKELDVIHIMNPQLHWCIEDKLCTELYVLSYFCSKLLIYLLIPWRAERLEKARKADEIRKFEAERLEAVFKAEAGAEERDRAQKQAKREADRQYR